jgi:hypothetical protein
MRVLLASTAIALLFGLSPASAMCGGDQQAGGGMCGASTASRNMSEKTAKDWPAAPGKEAQTEQKPGGMAMGGCPCCKNMAMMGGMKSDDPHKRMDMK